MITHFDLITGEILDQSADHVSDSCPTTRDNELALRLLPVSEAQTSELAHRDTPAAVIMLPIDQLLG